MFSLRFLAPAAFAALALCGTTARAATFNLTINGQSPQALIDVINTANSNGEADTINLSGYVNFTQADNTTYGATGFPVIKNDGGLTINATPSTFIGRIANSNNPKVRIFAIGPGAKVVINGLRFANGSAGAGSGESGDVAANRGGGIYNGNGGDLTLNGCDFDYNTAVAGAAVFNGAGASLKVTGGEIRQNTADADGGAIFNEAGTVSVEGAQFNGNSANGVDAVIGGNGGVLCNRSNAANGTSLGAGILTVRACNFGVVNGNVARRGAAIATETGSQTNVQSSYFNTNSARFGGAIFTQSALTIANSTFDASNASVEGGGIYSETAAARAQISNSTFANNRADGLGGAVRIAGGEVAFESCTVNRNSSFNNTTGGLSTAAGTIASVRNTIIAGNSGGDVATSATSGETIESGGYNLIGIGNAISGFGGPSDQTGVTDPKVNTLRRNEGATPTSALQFGSPAIDQGKSALSTDQLGVQRPNDIASIPNAPGGDGSDIGAVEFDQAQNTGAHSILLVNTTTDIDDGVCGLKNCTLREAIATANANPNVIAIVFGAKVFGDSRQTITLNGTSLTPISSGIGLMIVAPEVGVVIDGAGTSGIFVIAQGGRATLRNLTIRNGNDRTGAGINNKGTLNVVNCTLSDNIVLFDGGAIYNDYGTLDVFQSTLTDNSARDGSAVYNFRGTATIRNCTMVSDRTLYSTQNFPSNSNQAVMTVSNSIVAGDEAVTSISPGSSGATSSFQSGGYNIVSGGASINSFKKPGDQINIAAPDILLGALAENGGPTPTVKLLAGSPAINHGDPAFTGDFDQRGTGYQRIIAGRLDVGALEAQTALPSVTVTLSPAAPKTNDTLTATAVGNSPTNGSLTYSYQWFRNGTPIPNETESTLQLSKPGNGDKGDVIAVTVRASDSQGTSDPASAQVTVVNSAPVAISSQGTVPADTEKAFVLRAFDADGDALTFQRVGGPKNGVIADIRVDPADGQLKLFYKSRPFYGGVDVIRFVARDNDGKLSNESTLGITVQYTPPPPVNRAPVAGDTNIDTYVGDAVVKGLLGSDPDGDAITFRIVNNAKYGSSEIKRDTDGQFKLFYTSLNRFYGNDRVTYIAIDSRGKESNLATINIHFINRAPSAQNNNLSVASGELVSQYLFGTDADNDALTFRLVNNPQYGTGAIKRDEQGNWRVYYQSVPGYVGADRITFIAIDPFGKESQVATANINVVRVGPAPSAPGAIHVAPAPSSGKS